MIFLSMIRQFIILDPFPTAEISLIKKTTICNTFAKNYMHIEHSRTKVLKSIFALREVKVAEALCDIIISHYRLRQSQKWLNCFICSFWQPLAKIELRKFTK